MFNKEEEFDSFSRKLASKIYDKSNGKNAINLNFLKSCISESIPGKPDNFNINTLLNELRTQHAPSQSNESTVDLVLEFDFLDISKYSSFDLRGLAYAPTFDTKAFVNKIILDASYYDTSTNIESEFNHKLKNIFPDSGYQILKFLRTEDLSIKYKMERILSQWTGFISNDILNHVINEHQLIPNNPDDIAETIKNNRLCEFLLILSESPNFHELIDTLNSTKRIKIELIKSISYNDFKMQRFLLSVFQESFKSKDWMMPKSEDVCTTSEIEREDHTRFSSTNNNLNSSCSFIYKLGYDYGERVDMNTVPVPPSNLSKTEALEWQKGVSGAIDDRFS